MLADVSSLEMGASPPSPPLGSRGGPDSPTPSLAGRAVRAQPYSGPFVNTLDKARTARLADAEWGTRGPHGACRGGFGGGAPI